MKIGVLQLIDSLRVGGSEMVSVTIANNISAKDFTSHLIATREEGDLKKNLKPQVNFFYLNKKTKFDIRALLNLKRYVKKNNISIIHAHSTSIFFATLVKILVPRIKLIWHDHYGNSELLKERKVIFLKFMSFFIDVNISVNKKLLDWSKSKLNCKKYLIVFNSSELSSTSGSTKLKGNNDLKIVMVAGLRPQKDHVNLLNAFQLVYKKFNKCSLHIVGKDYGDEYSKSIKKTIMKLELSDCVHMVGLKPDIKNILSQSDIAVLSSRSEGLPLALIEYARCELPIVATNVGDCSSLVSNKEFLIEPEQPELFAEAIMKLMENEDIRVVEGKKNFKTYNEHFRLVTFISKIESIYKSN